jgi:hypothetical protein
VQAAIDFINDNSAQCPLKLINCYAWNEHTEGGYLNATHGDPDGTRLRAIMAAVGSP